MGHLRGSPPATVAIFLEGPLRHGADPQMNSTSAPAAPAVSQINVSGKSFSPLVKQFLDYLKLERHFSDYTVKSYGADLIQFAQYLAGEIGPNSATNPPSNLSPEQLDEKHLKVEPLTIRE